MKERPCTEADFLQHVKEHQVKIIREDGVYRHIRFKAPGTGNQLFDLTTWPGYLCFSGDMGTYVFQRADDMFQFFRNSNGELSINPDYWGEKLECVDGQSGFKKFSAEIFREWVEDHFKTYQLDNNELGEEIVSRIQAEIDTYIISELDDDFDQESRACRAVQEFVSDEEPSFTFQDFFDGGSPNEYTYRYIWCLYAIVWGISKYDEVKSSLREAEGDAATQVSNPASGGTPHE